ncbi:MAG TPA: glucosyltransferase domain-containing protein, partial [Bacteroidia bacterium]|nr:glucosyltransferase domain-containing protein [Bacteroidia bacterium]
VCLLFVSLLVFRDYFSLDEPNLFWFIRTGTTAKLYHIKFLGEGRPIYGFIQIGVMSLLKTMSQLKYLRLISVGLTGGFCFLLYRFLRKQGLSEVLSGMIAVGAFALPGFSVFLCWAEAFPNHLSSILSFLAGILACKGFAEYLGQPAPARKNLLLILAVLLQIISLFNYQGMALAFVLPGFFLLILKEDTDTRRKLIFFISFVFLFLLALGIYYKLYTMMMQSTQALEVDRGKLGNDLNGYLGKITFFGNMLVEASKMHLLLFQSQVVNMVFSVALLIVLVRDLLRKRFLDIFFLFAFSVLLFLPHFIVSENWGASRNFVLISLIMFAYLLLRLVQWMPYIDRPWLWLMVLPVLGILYMNVYTAWVAPQQKEYTCLQTMSEGLPLLQEGDSLHISVLLPAWDIHSGKSNLKFYKDEFNAPVCLHHWPVAPAIKVFYQDKNPEFSASAINQGIKVEAFIPDSASAIPNRAILLDMNKAIQ